MLDLKQQNSQKETVQKLCDIGLAMIIFGYDTKGRGNKRKNRQIELREN